jgi:hypothetical protein
MANSTWKSFERRLARSFGVERAEGSHGPDFVIRNRDKEYRAEAKKRSSTSGLKTVMGWLMGRDILFVGLKNHRDEDALVVMRKEVFDDIWDNQAQDTVIALNKDLSGIDLLHQTDQHKLIEISRRLSALEEDR